LNAIYSFLLESKENLSNSKHFFYFSNKFIKSLQSILQDLDQILDFRQYENLDFFKNPTNNQFLLNIIKHIEASFKLNCLQTELSSAESLDVLQGEFSFDFSELLYRMSSILISETEEFEL